MYFGGGTPSFLSVRQLDRLVERLTAVTPWTGAEEITFECEPGTLTESKLAAIRGLGVTRLSLGIENFDDRILELNGRAHRSPRCSAPIEFAAVAAVPADQHRSHRRACWARPKRTGSDCIEKTIELDPDSVTIYQMELPFNTTISGDVLKGTGRFQEHVASWSTKRRWVRRSVHALQKAGYTVGSAYTAVKDPERTKFIYRDRLWQGADLAGLGVASFGHINGVHMQNLDTWEKYSEKIREGALPLSRAYRPDPEERLIRELVLQLKLGRVRPPYFAREVRRRYPRAVRAGAELADRERLRGGGEPRRSSRSPAPACCGSMRCCRDSFNRSTPASVTPSRSFNRQ